MFIKRVLYKKIKNNMRCYKKTLRFSNSKLIKRMLFIKTNFISKYKRTSY